MIPTIRFPKARRARYSFARVASTRELGELVAIRTIVARSEALQVAVINLIAFSTGFAFEVLVRASGLQEGEEVAYESEYFQGGSPDEVFRFGLEHADGRRMNNLYRPLGTGSRAYGLAIQGREAEAKGLGYKVWSWPLPPGEELTFGCEWPAMGLELTFASLPARSIRTAGLRSGVRG
jgi:hypothetical protein